MIVNELLQAYTERISGKNSENQTIRETFNK